MSNLKTLEAMKQPEISTKKLEMTLVAVIFPSRLTLASVLLLVLFGLGNPAFAQRNCVKGKPCGKSCIAKNKTCRISTPKTKSANKSNARPSASRSTTVPANVKYVASSRGRVYYPTTCAAWRSLSKNNLRFFETAEDAVSAGYSFTTSSACGKDPLVGREKEEVDDEMAAATLRLSSPPLSYDSLDDFCVVQSITDGDTLKCDDDRVVRLLLIDAPEMGQAPFGEVSKAYLSQLAPVGIRLGLAKDVEETDRYGRTVAHLISPDGSIINEKILRAGLAVVAIHPSNVWMVDEYRRVALDSKSNMRGLWAMSAFECLPSDFRANLCQ